MNGEGAPARRLRDVVPTSTDRADDSTAARTRPSPVLQRLDAAAELERMRPTLAPALLSGVDRVLRRLVVDAAALIEERRA